MSQTSPQAETNSPPRERERARGEPPERDRVLSLLKRHGWNSTSFQVLEPGFRYYFDGDDACVAYVETGGAWVAAGEPIAPVQRLAQVAERFVRRAARDGRRVSFFGAEQRFIELAPFDTVLIGEQPVWNPRLWEQSLGQSRSLREQLRRARAKGVRVRRIEPEDVAQPDRPVRRAIEQLIARWLHSRSMAPMGFLVRVHPFDFAHERRIFVAENDRGICGLLVLVPLYARGGWLLEDLLRAPSTPNGTTELLVDAAMRCAAEEGCEYLTLGLAPLSGDVDASLRAARELGRGLYDFSGLRAYKAKLLPGEWSPIYLAFPRERNSYAAIYDSLVAFSQGGLLRFGVQTLLRGPTLVVRALFLLLLPWTLGLAALDPQRYFPVPFVKWSWVALDVGLAFALYRLTKHFVPKLARALAGVIALDAALTLWQVLSFNLRRARSPIELGALALAVCAPTFASVVLHNAYKRSTHAG